MIGQQQIQINGLFNPGYFNLISHTLDNSYLIRLSYMGYMWLLTKKLNKHKARSTVGSDNHFISRRQRMRTGGDIKMSLWQS